MRPVDARFPTSQAFGSFATAGVVGNWNGTVVQQLVAQYGNYQPFGHAGEDIACPVGTPVRAMADGTVLYAGWAEDLPGDNSEWGYRQRWYLYKGFPGIVTIIQHHWGIGLYAHLSNNDHAPAGTAVKEGQTIGLSGDTMTRTSKVGAHLHVEALVDTSYRTGGGLIYGRTNPANFYGAAATAPPPTPAAEEDEEMLIIGKAENDHRIFVGNGVTRRHIPNVESLNSLQWAAQNGWLKIYKNGEVQTIHPSVEMLGEDLGTQGKEESAAVVDRTQEQSDVTRQFLADKIKEASADDLVELVPDVIAGEVIEKLAARLAATAGENK